LLDRRPDGLPRIGLALITKNEAKTLPRLLESLGWTKPKKGPSRPLTREDAGVDYVVVCDTGSTDETRQIASRYGCEVVPFKWCDDFGAARQASYDALPEGIDFTLWADGDDVLQGAELLHELAAQLPANIAGTIHRYEYAFDAAGNCTCELWRERLVRRGIGERWKLPIHEVLEVPGQLSHSDQVVWQHRQPEDRKREPERNLRILQADYDQHDGRPEPRTLAYLGTELLALGRPLEAIPRFREYLERPDATLAEERCQVAHKLSVALRMARLGKPPAEEGGEAEVPTPAEQEQLTAESVQAAFQATQERPDWADGYLDLAELALDAGEPEKALRYCDVIGRLDPPRTLLIINPLEYTYQPLVMRAVALAQLKQHAPALEATQQALAVTPYREDLHIQQAQLAQEVKAEEATRAFLLLRELLVRHDENQKADELMACAPYFIWTRPEVAQARLDQRENVLHAYEPEVYGSYYRDNPGEAPFELQQVPIPEAHEAFHRVQFLREGLDAQVEASDTGKGATLDAGELRILDLSCNDGWMLANLATGGYGTEGALDGMELNTGAAERANGRRKEYPAIGTIVEANLFTAQEHFAEASYDAVVCFETIEHVPDPAALVAQMAKMVKPGGRIYVSTPAGAYENGNLPNWWVVEAKGHLRAMRAQELALLLCEHGVVQDFGLEQGVMVGSCEVSPRAGKVIFYAAGVEPQPEKIVTEGLGGSETALAKMAEQFARDGFDVRVYAGTGGGIRGDHISVDREVPPNGQVHYSPATEWNPGEDCDLFISSRVPEAFDRTITAPRRVLWLHDADYADRLTAERAGRATDILVLSEFQRDLLTERYPHLAEHPGLAVSRNAVEPELFPDAVATDREPWVVFSSSPDRGLDVLLECWPAIRGRAQEAGIDAQLHHTYAPVYHQLRTQPGFAHLATFHAKLEELAEAAGEGIVAHGSMTQPELAELFAKAAVWAYPSWNTPSGGAFPEISCISAMEAQAGGAYPVCLDYGALRETVNIGELIPSITAGDPPRLSTPWREQFVDAVVAALEGGEAYTKARVANRDHYPGGGWAEVCREWQGQFIGQASAPIIAGA
jgi:2-polyprenyl-3-methyl-5-hydroxy-6-metoxy-1,4-benzoquinol methylase/glycosyltransferase involved in cell wall biosynthesis